LERATRCIAGAHGQVGVKFEEAPSDKEEGGDTDPSASILRRTERGLCPGSYVPSPKAMRGKFTTATQGAALITHTG